jgi:hypothetical protein
VRNERTSDASVQLGVHKILEMQSLVDELSAALSLVKSWFKIADVAAESDGQ